MRGGARAVGAAWSDDAALTPFAIRGVKHRRNHLLAHVGRAVALEDRHDLPARSLASKW